MAWLIDVLVLAVIALFVAISAYRGFARTVVETVGFILSFVVAFYVSTPLAQVTYQKIIEPAIIGAVEKAVDDGTENASEAIWKSLPSFLRNNSDKIGISQEKIQNVIDDTTSGSVAELAKTASDKLVFPLAVKLIGILYFAVIVLVLLILSKILAKLCDKIFKIKILEKLNRSLGGVIGMIKGIMVVSVLCIIINFIVSFNKDGFWIFTSDNIAKTYLFKAIVTLLSFK